MRHLLSVPSAPGPHPILCFLHGYGEAAPLPLEQALRRHGPLRLGNPPGVEGFLVVAPQLPVAGDLWRRHAEELRSLVDEVAARHEGDLRRCYLTGFSFGGNGVFDLGVLQRDRWAALWAVDPTRVPRIAPERPTWLSFGDAARTQKEDFIRALHLEPMSETVNGERIWLDQGADHVGAAQLAYADERVYAWLLRHRSA